MNKLAKIFVVMLGTIFFLTQNVDFSEAASKSVVYFPFDASKPDAVIKQEFKVTEYRSYIFALKFNYIDSDDLTRLYTLVGGGGIRPDGTYSNPGIKIPVHIKIHKIENGQDIGSVSDNIIETQGMYANSFGKAKGTGSLLREIVRINLQPGTYLLEANSMKEIHEFDETQVFIKFEWHPNIRFLPQSTLSN
ncbi:DUF5625 family protein [Humidesulfovibrio idahonensis]